MGSLKVKFQAARGYKGVWGHSPQPFKNFYGFHIKNTHFSTLFYQKKVCSECSHYGQCKNILAA